MKVLSKLILFSFVFTALIYAIEFYKWNLNSLFSIAIESPESQSWGTFANSVSGIGDLNNDGYDEFIIGAPDEGTHGKAYVFFGANYDTLYTLTPPTSNTVDFGLSVSGAGDVNNDGINDFIVGTDYHSNHVAYVYNGATGDTLYELASPFPMIGGGFGRNVSGAGDVNNDGFDDVIVGASEEFPFGLNRAGSAYVFSGATGDTIYSLVSPNTAVSGYFGNAIAEIGDINNDNYDDVIVGAYNEDYYSTSTTGRAYIFSGIDGDTLFALQSPNAEYVGNFGYSVSGAGDVNNDGTNDVIVGARQETVSGNSVSGRAYVFSGLTGSVLLILNSPSPITYGYFGHSVAGVGDLNNDNYDDVFVGAFHEGVTGIARSGLGYIFSGATGDTLCSLQSLNPEQDGRFGWTASSAGDINNDGLGDIIVGAVGEFGGYPSGHGRAYLFSTNPLSGIEDNIEIIPQNIKLHQNYPNPFNPATTICYELNTKSDIELKIYNISGRLIKTYFRQNQNPGFHSIQFGGSKLASGTYFYKLKAGTFEISRKMVLLK